MKNPNPKSMLFLKSKCSARDMWRGSYFFKGTVACGPCPAPLRASVTRQATMLYAESSSEMRNKRFTNDSSRETCLYSLDYAVKLPFSCFRRFLLLQILTAQILRIMATMKKRIPPTTPAVMALCLTLAGTAYLIMSLMLALSVELAYTTK